MPQEIPGFLEELLLPSKKRHHQFLQLYLMFPTSGEEEATHHLPHQAAPEVLKENEPAGASGSLLSLHVFPEEEPV